MISIYKFYPKGFDAARFWDDKYAREHIAGKNSGAFAAQEFWPLLRDQLTPGKRYLDAGCGVGGWVIFLKEQGYDVEGVDVAARTIRALTEYDPDLKLKVANITQLPYGDGSFDGVLAIGTLDHKEGQVAAAFEEVHRVLESGGWFFFEVPAANVLRRLLYIPLKRFEFSLRKMMGHAPTFSYYLFSARELSQMLGEAGFEVITIRPHELPESQGHYGLYTDWAWLRGNEPYHLNWLGKIVRGVANMLSPWIASTGIVGVARKK